MADGLPTARTTLRTGYVRMLVFCNSCRHQADADLQALVDAGRGDVPLNEQRFRCSNCGTDRTDFVMTSRDVVKPW
jgi:transposase-like protein